MHAVERVRARREGGWYGGRGGVDRVRAQMETDVHNGGETEIARLETYDITFKRFK